MDRVEQFRSAGRTLFSLGLVQGTEGSLSSFDGTTMWVTTAGATLNELSEDAVVGGGLDDQIPGASSDVEVHRSTYRERGSGALVHAHPSGTLPEGRGESGEHGIYVFGPTLLEAAEDAVRQARALEGLNR
jgi:ribulose-5-phosphate 4-epimerase/fuculose-1-phosphate aldolase